jgi:2-polyprenyl-6-methoxyphenol hydroxylase-like FAD-dependent oxidoreductase
MVSRTAHSRPSSSNGPQTRDSGEDIKTKLARYKKEREELEQVRQQLRSKNQTALARSSPAAQRLNDSASQNVDAKENT